MDRPPGPPGGCPAATVGRCPRCSRSSSTAGWPTAALDRPIASVAVDDPHCSEPATTAAGLRRALRRPPRSPRPAAGASSSCSTPGRPTADGPSLGVRFGMTGGLLVDDRAGPRPAAPLGRPLHSAMGAPAGPLRRRRRARPPRPPAVRPGLPRPRRGRCSAPTPLTVTVAELRRALASPAPGGGPPLKARLLDQSPAGRGGQPAGRRDPLAGRRSPRSALRARSRPAEVRRLHRHLRGHPRRAGGSGAARTPGT